MPGVDFWLLLPPVSPVPSVSPLSEDGGVSELLPVPAALLVVVVAGGVVTGAVGAVIVAFDKVSIALESFPMGMVAALLVEPLPAALLLPALLPPPQPAASRPAPRRAVTVRRG